MKKYHEVKSKYLANAIHFVGGFQYFKHNKEDGSVIHTFEDTPELQECLMKVLELKRSYIPQVQK